ncbi:hypothetical protein [Pedobacter antarcticus]|uniref:hypothetical protein n=1 Tax=Pedobacter antarcticus TaxID=34086 RepID=UPI0029307E69|nr:hypothetical protein [Pedobacter antarcticus]
MTIYSEIKLRRPTEETCLNIEKIIDKYPEISASKALTRYINDVSRTEQIIIDLTNENRELKKLNQLQEFELYSVKLKLNDIRSTYGRLNSLLTGDKNET